MGVVYSYCINYDWVQVFSAISILCYLPVVEIVVVIVVGNGHGETSSDPGRDWLHFT